MRRAAEDAVAMAAISTEKRQGAARRRARRRNKSDRAGRLTGQEMQPHPIVAGWVDDRTSRLAECRSPSSRRW